MSFISHLEHLFDKDILKAEAFLRPLITALAPILKHDAEGDLALAITAAANALASGTPAGSLAEVALAAVRGVAEKQGVQIAENAAGAAANALVALAQVKTPDK